MKKDIPHLEVEGIKIAIARKKSEENIGDVEDGYQWHVYIINKNLVDLENVLITSRGYSDQKDEDGDQQKTSVLRHMIEKLTAQSYAVIEPIDPKLFQLFNEFWVSYYIERDIYDKKFVFVPDSVTEKHLMKIPELDLEGVMHS